MKPSLAYRVGKIEAVSGDAETFVVAVPEHGETPEQAVERVTADLVVDERTVIVSIVRFSNEVRHG